MCSYMRVFTVLQKLGERRKDYTKTSVQISSLEKHSLLKKWTHPGKRIGHELNM